MATRSPDNILLDTSTADVFTYIENLKSNNLTLLKVNSEVMEKNHALERKLSEAAFINKVYASLIERSNLKQTINSILKGAIRITRSEAGCIFLYNRKKDCMELMLTKGHLSGTAKEHLCRMYGSAEGLVLYDSTVQMNNTDASFKQLQAVDSSLRSMLAVPLITEHIFIGAIILLHRHAGEDEHPIYYSKTDCDTVNSFAQVAALILNNTRLKIEYGRKEVYLETITALVSAIDAKDAYTRNHSRNVARLSVALGKELKLTNDELKNIKYGALLHDVGKIGVPESVLNKKDSLNAREFDMIKAHPLIGSKILAPIDFLEEALDIVRYHHERFDGTGYPERLRGENIPFEARIVCIADAWDAMTSDRAYRKALTVKEALQQLQEGAGTQFDPWMVKKFLAMETKN